MTNSAQPSGPSIHDLNNELGFILAECEILEVLLSKDRAAAERVRTIKKATQRIADTVLHLSSAATRND